MAVRGLVADSWARSVAEHVDPERAQPNLALGEDELIEYRAAHPLATMLPVIQRLLVRHSLDSGLIVAIGDAEGRLLWVDGDRELRRRAETMLFVEGADWSERRVGTSAPGTALALGRGVQIHRDEHFSRIVHPWSCTAAPVRDPGTHELLGVIDVTGGDTAGHSMMLPFVEAAVAAVEAELRASRLQHRQLRGSRARAIPVPQPRLEVLGRETARISSPSATHELSIRHSEIMLMLAWHEQGLTAERLAELVYGDASGTVTLRAELVRMRHVLPQELQPLSRPYRSPAKLDLDVRRVLGFLERGAHRVALGSYTGPVLPRSSAPGVVELREEMRETLRGALLAEASADTLYDYAKSEDGQDDLEVWLELLRMLPARSPRRARVVSRIERLQAL